MDAPSRQGHGCARRPQTRPCWPNTHARPADGADLPLLLLSVLPSFLLLGAAGIAFLRFTATHRTRSRVTLTIMAAAADSALCSDMLHPLPALLCPATCSLLFPSPFPACSPSPLRLSACLLHLRFPLQRERFGYQSAHPPHRPTTCLPASSYQFLPTRSTLNRTEVLACPHPPFRQPTNRRRARRSGPRVNR